MVYRHLHQEKMAFGRTFNFKLFCFPDSERIPRCHRLIIYLDSATYHKNKYSFVDRVKYILHLLAFF